MDEEWKPIAGYEGLYAISNLGRVKSIERVVDRPRGDHCSFKTNRRRVRGRILKTHLNFAGGRQGGRVNVTICKEGVMRQFQMHRLVAEAFIPNPENFSDVSHKDHNPQNNRVDNLEWLSHMENIRDSVRSGRWRKKLSESEVVEILRRAKAGEQQVTIAKSLGLAYGTVNSIVTGRSWKHLSVSPTAVTFETVNEIANLLKLGKSPAEILALLPQRKKKQS